MKFENIFILLLQGANLVTLEYLVKNDISLIDYFLHEGWSYFSYLGLVRSLTFEVSVDEIMISLQKNRPDIARIVTRRWIDKQIEDAITKLGLKIKKI